MRALLLRIAVLIIFLILNAILSAAEIAFISVNYNRIKKRADEGHRKSAGLLAFIEKPGEFLASIQIGSSLIALLSGAFAAQSFSGELTAAMIRRGVMIDPHVLSTVNMVIIVVVLAYFNLVFAELSPKRIAMIYPDRIAYALIGPVQLFSRLVMPITRLLSASTNLFLRAFGLKHPDNAEKANEEEIRLLVDVGAESGNIGENESEMIKNIFEFDDKTAGDILTHRTDISALPADATFDEIAQMLIESRYSRIPVYEDSIDDIIGVLHTKVMLKYLVNHGDPASIDLRSMLMEPYFVPASKKANLLFREMQRNKVHITVVIDEYGGTAGIVTMEDLIEEIMGSIADEYDEEETPEIQRLEDGTFLVSGAAGLEDVAESVGVALPEDEYDTLGGYIISLLGRIPEDGEQPDLELPNMTLRVQQIEDKRVISVKLIKKPS